ncbi:hypothetical protein Dsin_008369, partial [Dipteronia sinensis]
LSSLIQRDTKNGQISGFKCVHVGPTVTHMLFADDSLLSGKETKAKCATIRDMLDMYTRASSQMVNYRKSTMCVSPNFSKQMGTQMAAVLGVLLVDCHERYLGLPCLTWRNKRKVFTNIVDRVWDKIKGWHHTIFSVGGKEILIKAVIQSFPIYVMSLFRLLVGFLKDIGRMCARFLWGTEEGKK